MIVIIEDDPAISALEAYALRSSGYEAEVYSTGKLFFESHTKNVPDLVILDVMLPDMDGYEILRRLRTDSRTREVPVLMVTAKGSEVDIVQGLNSGADDYLSKPFGIMEMLSRVNALLRRTKKPAQGKEWSFGPIVLKESSHEVFVDDHPVELTFKEYELLHLFLQKPEVAISRDEMMDKVWHSTYTVESRTVDMHVRTLRQKLGAAGELIQTVRKVGYILTDRAMPEVRKAKSDGC